MGWNNVTKVSAKEEKEKKMKTIPLWKNKQKEERKGII